MYVILMLPFLLCKFLAMYPPRAPSTEYAPPFSNSWAWLVMVHNAIFTSLLFKH